MTPPEYLVLTHWPLNSSDQFLLSPLSLQDLQPIIPIEATTRCLGLHPFNWSEVIKVTKANADPVVSVSFSLPDSTTSYVTTKLVLQSCSDEAGDQDLLQNSSFVAKVNQNEFNVQTVLPTSGRFILNIYLNNIRNDKPQHLSLSYIIESELCHDVKVGYPCIYPLQARAFSFVPRYWNAGRKSYNCVHSGSTVFSIVFEASADVSFHHCLIRGRATNVYESKPSDVYHHQTLLVGNSRSNGNLRKLLALFPDEGWWTICISGTRTSEGSASGYTSVLTYQVYAEEGSRKMSYPHILMPGTIFFPSNPITSTDDRLTTIPFTSSKPLNFYHYLTLEESGSEIWEGYSNIELVRENDEQGYTDYALKVVFPKAGMWSIYVYDNTPSNVFDKEVFELKVTVDNRKLNTDTFLIQSNASLLKEYEMSLLNNGMVTFEDDGQPFSFEFITAHSDIDLLHELRSPDGSSVDYCTYLTQQDGLPVSYTLSAIFPSHGKWTVELFASKAGKNSYHSVLQLKVNVKNPVTDHCYPKIYPAFRNFGCKLLEENTLLMSSMSGEFKLPFQASSDLYFFFKVENEAGEDFSQQAFVYATQDTQNRILHLIIPECGHWKLNLHAKQLQRCTEQTDTTALLLQISVRNDECIRNASFPLLYEQFHELRLHFDPKDLPLPSVIENKFPQRFSINYYCPPDVQFVHYAEVKIRDGDQNGGEACDEVTERVMTRMTSNNTGLHQLQVEVVKRGLWTVLLYASTTDVPESPDKWKPVMKYMFCTP